MPFLSFARNATPILWDNDFDSTLNQILYFLFFFKIEVENNKLYDNLEEKPDVLWDFSVFIILNI